MYETKKERWCGSCQLWKDDSVGKFVQTKNNKIWRCNFCANRRREHIRALTAGTVKDKV